MAACNSDSAILILGNMKTSGSRAHRPGHTSLGSRHGAAAVLDRGNRGVVEEVVVAHRDRLCRLGIELVEHLFRKAGTRLVVHEHAHDVPDHPDRTAELAEDLIAITTAFVARHHG